MTLCTSCGGENADGAKFCVRCGGAMGASSTSANPEPGSWLNTEEPGANQWSGQAAPPPASGYSPPSVGSQPQSMVPPSLQYQAPGGAQQMHPAVPALISFFFPGLGLLFLPDRAGLAIGIFAGYVAVFAVGFVLTLVFIGICLLLLLPIANILAAIYTWDEAAKLSGGQFQPLLFKK